MRKLHIVIIVALACTTVAEMVFAAIAQSASSSKSQELATAQYENASTQEALRATASAAATSQSVAATAQSVAATAQSAAATVQSEVRAQHATVVAQSSQIRDLRIQLAASNCVLKPSSIDYSSASSVSNSLKTWLEDTHGSIDDSKWDVIWNNSRTTTFNLTGEYLYVFIAFFDEPELGKTNAVFDVSNMCWLDR